jgi:hypothetical protein
MRRVVGSKKRVTSGRQQQGLIYLYRSMTRSGIAERWGRESPYLS